MGKLNSIVSVLLILVATFPAQAGQLRPEEKQALGVKPAVALVLVQFTTTYTSAGFPDADPIKFTQGASGTGFFFRPDGYFITNGHVVQYYQAQKDNQAMSALQQFLIAQFAEKVQTGEIFAYFEHKYNRPLTPMEKLKIQAYRPNISISDLSLSVITANSQVLNADVMQFSPPFNQNGKDVAVLKIPKTNMPTVPLGNSDNVRLQEPVMVVGYPGLASQWGGGSVSSLLSRESNLEPSATNGHISALKVENIGTPLLQSDVAITHGNSGGPAFNDHGEVIGLATYGATEVQGFNFLVPINTAMEFVRQTGVTPEEGAFNKHWINALNLYDAGKCISATREFDNVQQMMQGLPDAAKYRAAAMACVDKMSWWDKTMETTGPVPMIALGAVVLLGLIVLIRMRKPTPAPVAAQAAGAAAAPGMSPRIGATVPQVGSLPGSPPPALPGPGESYGSIQFISGPLSGRSFKIGKEGLWIGRDPGKCGVVVPDDAVSGQHAWVVPVDRGVVVIDKESTNGTYVNSVDSPRVSKVGLNNGDRIYLGKKGAAAFTYFRN